MALKDFWLEAFCATMFMIVAPFVILLIVPMKNTDGLHPFIKLLLTFASGSLLGNTFLRIIPHAHSDNQKSDNIDLWVLSGVIAYVVLEKSIGFFKLKSQQRDNSVRKEENKRGGKFASCVNLAINYWFHFVEPWTLGTGILDESALTVSDLVTFSQSQMSPRYAILWQLIMTVGTIAGTFFAIRIQDVVEIIVAPRIRFFASGCVIYMALASAIPEFLKFSEEKLSFIHTVLRGMAMLSGFCVIYMVPKSLFP